MIEYRCPKCNNLFFIADLKKGSEIIVVCKKINKLKNGKYVKCKNLTKISI